MSDLMFNLIWVFVLSLIWFCCTVYFI